MSLQSLSSIPELLPVRKELIDLLHYSYELEVAGVEHSLASTLIGVQLRRHELSIEKLLHHSSELMEVIEMQRRVMDDHSLPPPPDLALRYGELVHRQESLVAQVAAEKQLPPVVGAGMQVRHELANCPCNIIPCHCRIQTIKLKDIGYLLLYIPT